MGPTASSPASSESTDRDSADFAAGTASGGIHLATTSTGPEVLLTPAVAAEFNGDTLPSNWFVEAWKEGGTAELTNGPGAARALPSAQGAARALPSAQGAARALRLDGTRVGHSGLFGSNRSLEFAATFTRRPHQHVGFGTNFKDVPWVSFSTKFGHSVYARSNFFMAEDTRLAAALLGSSHRYRIDWNVIDLHFWVDGKRVAHQLVPIVGYMRPLASNGSVGGDPLLVEWMRMSPYRPEGEFTSRVHDAGGAAVWASCEWEADQPANTAVSTELRTGDTKQPDETWSAWSGQGGQGRFAQYRARLTTSDPSYTPVLRKVTLRYSTSDGGGPGSSSSGSF